jgi:mersacidin/lichenicidin family type 2 lantibiotic
MAAQEGACTMNKADDIRTWKDPLYRATLTAEELDQMPVHPAGILDLDDDQLRVISGSAVVTTTAIDCTDFTFANWRRCCP